MCQACGGTGKGRNDQPHTFTAPGQNQNSEAVPRSNMAAGTFEPAPSFRSGSQSGGRRPGEAQPHTIRVRSNSTITVYSRCLESLM